MDKSVSLFMVQENGPGEMSPRALRKHFRPVRLSLVGLRPRRARLRFTEQNRG